MIAFGRFKIIQFPLICDSPANRGQILPRLSLVSFMEGVFGIFHSSVICSIKKQTISGCSKCSHIEYGARGFFVAYDIARVLGDAGMRKDSYLFQIVRKSIRAVEILSSTLQSFFFFLSLFRGTRASQSSWTKMAKKRFLNKMDTRKYAAPRG